MLIPRKKPGGHGGPDTLAWMMSYADMATILLAMFIVLSTFAKDQTGISLYYGTGSFRAAVTSFGLPGLTPNSARVVGLEAPGPQHTLGSESDVDSTSSKATDGSNRQDDSSIPKRVIDAEEERFQTFLGDLSRHLQTDKLPRSAGQTSLDFYDKLAKTAPYLTAPQREQIAPLMALLRQGGYRIQVTVWSGIPNESANTRSAIEAAAIVQELADGFGLDAAARRRLVAVGQSWAYRDVQRPVMSVIVTRTE